MPPIKNWSRRRDLESGTFGPERVWENGQTSEIAWISEKVPNDGYYFNVCESEDQFNNKRHTCERHGYSHLKTQAMRTASYELRENPDGFY